MEGKIAAQRPRLAAKTGMDTLSFVGILCSCIVGIQCCWTVDVLGGNPGKLVEKFELNFLRRPIWVWLE